MFLLRGISLAFLAVAAGSANAARSVTAVLDVLAYNDVYEMQQDTVNGLNLGGPSRVVPLAKELRAKNPNTLVLFAGDTMSPSLWSSQFKGLQMVDAHNAIGVDFACLGNHEFDFGIDAFLNVSAATNFPWLNANCYEISTGALLRGTTPRAVKEFNHPTFGKLKIGLFGVMYDMKDTSKGLFWTDPIEAAKRQVAQLQTMGVDMIIALTHQELVDDNRLSKDVPGIHMIYAGHDHASMLQTNFGTPYVKADFDFRSVWKSHIEYFAKDGSNAATFRMQHTALPIVEEMPTDPVLDKVIADYSKKIGVLFSRVVGTLCAPLDLTNKVVRAMDAPIGHLFTDAQLHFYGGAGDGDVVVMNGGGIRTDKIYPAGPLTLGELVAWSPFGNTIMVVKTDGASLKKFITREMVGSCGAGVVILNGLYVHTAGVKYTFQCTAPGVGKVTSLEWAGHATRFGPVADTDSFKLVLSNFLFTSEFSVIPGVSYTVIIKEAEATRVDAALEAYAKAQPNATLCENDRTVRSFVSF
jgi:2',3'-cyclic-nucleotide 2'-phosphodiesterase (5'-nucleotidase family)